ncbi:MAG TPA: hypothetical protein VFM71_10405, partial [Gemmatimonadaceae bacterium]|nr:hypothetical protein [Gemmatimonadaceae bacterium]
VVTLPPSGDPGPPVAFSYSVSAPYGVLQWFNGRITDAGTAHFSAGQTKRAVFDLRAEEQGLDGSFEPGQYIARGGFSSRYYDAEASFAILP